MSIYIYIYRKVNNPTKLNWWYICRTYSLFSISFWYFSTAPPPTPQGIAPGSTVQSPAPRAPPWAAQPRKAAPAQAPSAACRRRRRSHHLRAGQGAWLRTLVLGGKLVEIVWWNCRNLCQIWTPDLIYLMKSFETPGGRTEVADLKGWTTPV